MFGSHCKLAMTAGELLSGCDEFWRAVLFDLFEIVAALAAAVDKDHERPFLCRIGLVALGFAQQVVVADLDDKIAAVGLWRLCVG